MESRHKIIKKVFIFFLFYLPLQYVMVGIIGVYASEPWPAFVFPGFKSVMAKPERIKIIKPVFFVQTDHHEKKIDTKILFDGLQESQRLGFLRTNFYDSTKAAQLSSTARHWLKHLITDKYNRLKNVQGLRIQWLRISYMNKKNDEAVQDSIAIDNNLEIEF